MLILNFNQKNRWMCKYSRKLFNYKNRWGYSLWVLNVNNLRIWSYGKQTFFISWKRLYEKVLFSLREHAKNINDFERKMKPLTNEELKSHEDARVCFICGKYFLKNLPEDINHRKVRDNCYYKRKIWRRSA